MRVFLFILITLCTLGVSAQSPAVLRPFDEATRSANNGDFEKALEAYQSSLAAAGTETVKPDLLARLHYDLGVCHYQLDRPASAITEFQHAIEISRGGYSRAFYAMGMAETALAHWPNARAAFLRAIDMDSTNGEYWFDLAVAFLGEKDLGGAEIAFRRSIDYHTVDAALSHNNLGVILAMRGKYSQAHKEFEAAGKLSRGRLSEAEHNLEYCRELEQAGSSPSDVRIFTVAKRADREL